MNADSYVTILVAVGCIAAVGMSATTLESSLDTDPADAVDLNYDYLPIGEGEAASVQEHARGSKGGSGDRSGSPGNKRSQDATGGGQNEGSDSSSASESDPDGTESSGGSTDRAGQQTGGSGQSGDGTGGTGVPNSLLDLLKWLAVLLLVAGLVYRYRERLLALGYALVGWLAAQSEAAAESRRGAWPHGRPSNDVHRAWVAMVKRADVDDPRSKTPAECARAAIERGMDAEAVESLTRLFEDVRYGDAQPTKERAQEARNSLRTLGDGRVA